MGQHSAAETRTCFVLVVLCAILLLFGTTLQQAHFHADGLTHADCTICHTAPHVVQPSASCIVQLAPIPSTRVVLSIKPVYREHTFSYSHWNRPPPDQTAIA
ncbi:MAG TPA: hypothetical protein VGF82_26780 [Terracidiphilus sp.]